jgi:hypothetical protein
LFDDLLHQNSSYSKVVTKLKLTDLDEERDDNRKLYWMMQWIRYSLLTEKEFNSLAEEDAIKKFGHGLWNYGVSRERLIPVFAQQLSMFSVV